MGGGVVASVSLILHVCVCVFDIVSICIWTGGDDDTTQPKVKFLMGRLLSLILPVCPYVCHGLFFPLH